MFMLAVLLKKKNEFLISVVLKMTVILSGKECKSKQATE